MSEFAPGQDRNQLATNELSLPAKFSCEEWKEATRDLEPIYRGNVLANIFFRSCFAEQVVPETLRHNLPHSVIGGCLRLLHGDDKQFVHWLNNDKLKQSDLLPVYPEWKQIKERKFSLIAAAVDRDSNWQVLIVIQDKNNNFIAPKFSRRQALLLAAASMTSNNDFIGVICHVNSAPAEAGGKITSTASILTEPELEVKCLQNVQVGTLKVADLLNSSLFTKLPNTKNPFIEGFYSFKSREGYYILKDKGQDTGLLLAQYVQQAGVLGRMHVYGPFTHFDDLKFRDIYKNFFPVNLDSVRPGVLKLADQISEFKDLASGVESSKSKLWAEQILDKTLPGLVFREDLARPEDFITSLDLLRFKPNKSEIDYTSWCAIIEFTHNSNDPDSELSSDNSPSLLSPSLLAIEIVSKKDKDSSAKADFDVEAKLIKAFFCQDSFELQLKLLASETPSSSVLYWPILSKIKQDFILHFENELATISDKVLTKQAESELNIELSSVGFYFDSTQYKTINLLIQHSLGYSWIALQLSNDGSLLFESAHPQYESIKVCVSLYYNSNQSS